MRTAVEKIVKPTMVGGRAVWAGFSGTTYETSVEPIGGNFLQMPGVYIFCSLNRDELQPVYVGHTDDLERRLTVDLTWHPYWHEIVEMNAHFICSHPVENDAGQANAIALDLKRGVRPSILG